MTRTAGSRDGFALGAILWVLTVGAVLGAAAALQGRAAFEATRNRIHAEQAYWIAEGCAAEVREAFDRALQANPITLPRIWQTMDAAVEAAAPTLDSNCRYRLEAVGSTIDVNGADALLRKYFRNGVGAASGDALTDAVLDWRDADDDPSPSGAERSWYTANKRPAPRNNSLTSVQELALVRGFEARPDLMAYLTVEPSRVSLTTAPAPVLTALPGFTDEAVAKVLDDRANGVWFGDLNTLRGKLPQAASDSILAHFQELALTTTADPNGWMLSVAASAGDPPVVATTELRLDRYADRAVVLWRRTQ